MSRTHTCCAHWPCFGLMTGTPNARNPAKCAVAWQMWQTNRVVGYIDSNLASAIRSRDLARLVNLSESHFSRAFKSSVGVPPHRYITRRRIELAREMMRASDQGLAQIAVVCGWSDQSHFCRAFRRGRRAEPR